MRQPYRLRDRPWCLGDSDVSALYLDTFAQVPGTQKHYLGIALGRYSTRTVLRQYKMVLAFGGWMREELFKRSKIDIPGQEILLPEGEE